MSDEKESLIESYIPDNDVRYPMIRTPSDADWKVKGFPTVYLISPDRQILHVGMPTNAQIEDALKAASLVPEMPDTSTFSDIRKAWEKFQFSKALKRVGSELRSEQLDRDEKAVLDGLRKRLEGRREMALRAVERAMDGPDYYVAQLDMKRIAKEWDGMEPADRAEDMLDRFDDDPTIKAEIRASKGFARLSTKFRDLRSSPSKRARAIKTLQVFVTKCEGTFAAKQARAMISRLSQ